MRRYLYGTISIPLLIVDVLLISNVPDLATRFYSVDELVPWAGGIVAYCVVHAAVRKPDRFYLWGHELTHLIVAKLFLRTVHGFHITSRDGGRVVIDGTNLWIDLAPYLFPFYNLLLLACVGIFKPSPPWGTALYLMCASFLFSMHLYFSSEGFLQGQPDLKRSGRVFSFALVLLFIVGIAPVLLAPGTAAGWEGLDRIYGYWGKQALEGGFRLFRSAASFQP